MSVGHLYVFFGKMSIWVPCPLFKSTLFVLILPVSLCCFFVLGISATCPGLEGVALCRRCPVGSSGAVSLSPEPGAPGLSPGCAPVVVGLGLLQASWGASLGPLVGGTLVGHLL